MVNDEDDIEVDEEAIDPSLSQFFKDCLSRPFSEDVIPTGPHAETVTLPKEDLTSQVDQVQSSKRKLKPQLSPKNVVKASQKEANKRKSTSVKAKASKR